MSQLIERTLDEKVEMMLLIIYKITGIYAEYKQNSQCEDWINTINNFPAVEENVRHQFQLMLNKIEKNFNTYDGFTHDLFRFCLYDLAEFVELLIQRIKGEENENKEDLVDKLIGAVSWYTGSAFCESIVTG